MVMLLVLAKMLLITADDVGDHANADTGNCDAGGGNDDRMSGSMAVLV